MATFTYFENGDDNARTNFSFDQTGGSSRAYYQLLIQDPSFLQQAIQDVIGYTYQNAGGTSGTSALSRIIPCTHPRFPWLYASRISSMVGTGRQTAFQVPPTAPSNPAIGFRPIANYLYYPGQPTGDGGTFIGGYELGIDFTSRTYPLIADGDFTPTASGTWYTKSGTLNNFTYATEWVRYCDYDFTLQDNTIQGNQGSMSLIDGGQGSGKFVPFQNPPWVWLPDQILKITWYQVPYRFLTSQNSYIAGSMNRNWRGRINQNSWWNWPAGSLLYLGFNVKKYTPPIGDIGTYPSITGNYTVNPPTVLGNIVNYERLCDIELNFLLTYRYLSGSLGDTIGNGNYIPAGHNLLPSVSTGLFYYATRNDPTSGAASVRNPPAWYSFPVEALFSDPDVAGGPTTTGDN